MIEIECGCGWRRTVKHELLGRRVRCKACGKGVAVELSLTPAPEPPAPSGNSASSRLALLPARPARGRRPAKRPPSKTPLWQIVLLCVLLLVLWVVVTPEWTTWRRFRSEAGRFSVTLPSQPQVLAPPVGAAGPTGLYLESWDERYVVLVHDAGAPPPPPIEHALESSPSCDPDSVFVKTRVGDVVEVWFRERGEPRFAWGRQVHEGGRTFDLLVVTTSGFYDGSTAHFFLNSLKTW